jgi:hypothetical protein
VEKGGPNSRAPSVILENVTTENNHPMGETSPMVTRETKLRHLDECFLFGRNF